MVRRTGIVEIVALEGNHIAHTRGFAPREVAGSTTIRSTCTKEISSEAEQQHCAMVDPILTSKNPVRSGSCYTSLANETHIK